MSKSATKITLTILLLILHLCAFAEQQPYPKAKGYAHNIHLFTNGHDLGDFLCANGASNVTYSTDPFNDFVTIYCYKDDLIQEFFGGSFPWLELCRVPGHDVGEYCLAGESLDIKKNLGPRCPAVGNPINPSIENKHQTESDYQNFSSPLAFNRTYNSVSDPDYSTLSFRWVGSYDRRLHQTDPSREGPGLSSVSNGYIYNINYLTNGFINFTPSPSFYSSSGHSSINMTRPDGTRIRFVKLNGSSDWSSDKDITAVLIELPNTWQYKDLDGTIETYDINGQLISIEELNGNMQTLTYDHVAHTTTVTDVRSGHSLILSYDPVNANRLVKMADPDGGIYRYAYNSNGMLEYVSYPDATNSAGSNPFGEDNSFRQYHYEDVLYPKVLTGITDERGVRFATWTYDSDARPVSSAHNQGTDTVTIDYTNLSDGNDQRTTVTNSLGKRSTYHFTTINGVRKVSQIEGHPSANCVAANKNYTYDINGFIASKTDWKGVITSYIRNTKGQELTRTEALGTPEARIITTEWHATFNLPTKITEPDRETTFTYDANGNQLTKVVTDVPL